MLEGVWSVPSNLSRVQIHHHNMTTLERKLRAEIRLAHAAIGRAEILCGFSSRERREAIAAHAALQNQLGAVITATLHRWKLQTRSVNGWADVRESADIYSPRILVTYSSRRAGESERSEFPDPQNYRVAPVNAASDDDIY